MFEDRGSATLEAGDEAEDPAVDQRRDPTNRGGGGYRGNRDDNRAFPPTCKRDFFIFFFPLSPPFRSISIEVSIAFDHRVSKCATGNVRLG